jgi:hypothetical protein
VVQRLERVVVNDNVVLYILAGELHTAVLARAMHAHGGPVGEGDGDTEDHDEEAVGVPSAAVDEGKRSLDKPGYAEDEASEDDVGERAIAVVDACRRRIRKGGHRGGDDGLSRRHREARRAKAKQPVCQKNP